MRRFAPLFVVAVVVLVAAPALALDGLPLGTLVAENDREFQKPLRLPASAMVCRRAPDGASSMAESGYYVHWSAAPEIEHADVRLVQPRTGSARVVAPGDDADMGAADACSVPWFGFGDQDGNGIYVQGEPLYVSSGDASWGPAFDLHAPDAASEPERWTVRLTPATFEASTYGAGTLVQPGDADYVAWHGDEPMHTSSSPIRAAGFAYYDADCSNTPSIADWTFSTAESVSDGGALPAGTVRIHVPPEGQSLDPRCAAGDPTPVVEAGPPPVEDGSLGWLFDLWVVWLLLGGIVVVVLVLILYLSWRARRRPRGPHIPMLVPGPAPVAVAHGSAGVLFIVVAVLVVVVTAGALLGPGLVENLLEAVPQHEPNAGATSAPAAGACGPFGGTYRMERSGLTPLGEPAGYMPGGNFTVKRGVVIAPGAGATGTVSASGDFSLTTQGGTPQFLFAGTLKPAGTGSGTISALYSDGSRGGAGIWRATLTSGAC